MPVKPTVVIAYDEFPDIEVEQGILHGLGAEVVHTRNLTSPQALELTRRSDALMVTIQRVSADLLAGMTRCRIVSRVGTGLDAIDVAAATERGIWVTNVPDYSVEEVSTHTVALLLAQARRLPQLIASTQQGRWDSKFVRPIPRLQGQVLGLLGFGRIGRATAAKAIGLGLKVIAHDPFVPQEVATSAGIRLVDWPTLLRESDYVSLHAPLNEQTRGIISPTALAQMKPTAYLINTARGALIDEAALLAAVNSGQIAGAALDVFSIEPPEPSHAFLSDPRILATPHIAWYSEAANYEVRVRSTEEVVRVLRGEPPCSPANRIPATVP